MEPTPEVEMKIFEARVAEQAECYQDMFDIITDLIDVKLMQKEEGQLFEYTNEERVLMSSCFKNLIAENQETIKTMFVVKDVNINTGEKYRQVQIGLDHFT